MSKKIFSLLLVAVMLVGSLASCRGGNNQGGESPGGNSGSTDTNKEVVYEPIDLADVVERTDYRSVYEMIGSRVSIDMVEENADGLAFVTVDGVRYELGMDFLSMAMVYNTKVPLGSPKYVTEEDVYNEWFKLYTVRWNYLVAEVPLYSNEYFDLYNAKIENFKTGPYWGPADAIISASVKPGFVNSVILGSVTDLSGSFRSSAWGKSSPAASDQDIEQLTSGYATMQTNFNGSYVYNMNVLAI